MNDTAIFQGKQVLVVDDEQGYLDMYVYVLEPLGIKVTCARNGEEAVEKIKEKAYDLMFMDVHMPKMDGHEAFKRIKAFRPEQKIVIFSSSSDPNLVREQQVLDAGAVECLFKPMGIDEIERILKKVFH